tara:strand:+ start:726 stop:923 length:198 start_codon:yes stop_codon:yes gene_type:complete
MKHYKVFDSADVADALSNPHCVTKIPRYSLAGDQAILSFLVYLDGCINHEEALELVQGPDWQTEE